MKLLAFLVVLATMVACQEFGPSTIDAEDEFTLFSDISRSAGIVQTRRGNDRAIGQAWGDYNRDGWVDFYVTDTKGSNTLFRNNGDGTFGVAPQSGTLALPDSYSGGASFADYDNDGWLDLFVVNWGKNVLFHNEAGQRFSDVTDIAGVGDEANGQTASWGDYDNDGFLDLYVANWSCYPKCGRPSSGESDRLYHNNGDGTFRDVTQLLKTKTYGAGFVASFSDYDNDGDLDIYLVNDEFIDPVGNVLWRNDGPGCEGHCFTEVSVEATADTRVMGMGLATADYDNDGDFDFYFSNAGPMTLLQNQGDATFQDVAPQAGVDMPSAIAWGAVALDYDNDGWQDLYLAVMTTANHRGIPANPLFHNNGDGTFSRVRSGSGAGDVGPTMGVATADFDKDGWVDLLIGNRDDGYSLLQNQVGRKSDHHWLTIELVGGHTVNRDAVGSRVTVLTANGVKQVRQVQNGSSLGAGNELALHFGLATADTIAELTIQWPDGLVQRFERVPVDRRVYLTYPIDAAANAAQLAALYPADPLRSVVDRRVILVLAILIGVMLLALLTARNDTARLTILRYRWAVALVLMMGMLLLTIVVTRKESEGVSAGDRNSLLRQVAAAGAAPPQRLPPPSPAAVALGEALFWDPLLSGNKDVSCATCHHPTLATGDGLSLSIGTGGRGLGVDRSVGERHVLIPRNATPIFNLGIVGMETLFWDGRVSGTSETGFSSPANDDLPFDLDNAVAVQAMFPVTSRDEMRGSRGDHDIAGKRNELAGISDHDWNRIWAEIMARLLAIPAYERLFSAAFPTIDKDELGFEHAANALAAYQIARFTFLDSPWDRFLQGDETALSPIAQIGVRLFYGKAGCAQCHSGPLLSDMRFHNIGVPQVGPGKGFEEPLDYGRARETGDESDLFAFRTPPLRNVAVTGPWMHNGAYTTLQAAVRHHLDPSRALEIYESELLSPLMQATNSTDPAVLMAASTVASFTATEMKLSDDELAALLAFLQALTSPSAQRLSHTIPATVPSGLKVGGS